MPPRRKDQQRERVSGAEAQAGHRRPAGALPGRSLGCVADLDAGRLGGLLADKWDLQQQVAAACQGAQSKAKGAGQLARRLGPAAHC